MVDIIDVATKVRQMAVLRAQRAAVVTFGIKVFGIPIAAGIAGICQFMDFGKDGASISQIMGITGTFTVGLLSLIVGLFDKDAGEELAEAARAIDVAREFQNAADQATQVFEEYEDELRTVNQAWLTQSLSRAVLEPLIVGPTGTIIEWLDDFLEATFRAFIVAVGFETGHRWSISIYQAQERETNRYVLKNVATRRAMFCDLSKAREWPEGTGVAGVCYANRCELVFPDVNDPGVNELFTGKVVKSHPDDAELYKSISASPIQVTGTSRPWGVVVATNDQAGHFDVDNDKAVRPDMVVKELAGMASLVIAAYAAISAGQNGALPNRSVAPSGTP